MTKEKTVNENLAVVILAAGKGSRMKSDLPKVLHKLAGASLIKYVLATAESLNPTKIIPIIAPTMTEDVGKAVEPHAYAIQKEQKGTGHAVLATKEHLKGFKGNVLVLFGDVPLIRSATLASMVSAMESTKDKTGILLLGMRPYDPKGYGRILQNADGSVKGMVEDLDCTEEERKVNLVWSGIMLVDGARLFNWIEQVSSDNAQNEIYLPYIVNIAKKEGAAVHVVECDTMQVQGINSKNDLARAEYAVQQILRTTHLDNGVTLLDPETVSFSIDTKIGADSVIEPNVFFGRKVVIGKGTTIKAFSHIEETTIGDNCSIGPFARLRPETVIHDDVKIGNFVEIKKSVLDEGAKVSHLSYIGDASIGENANIGAGTITCNYDGYLKHKTKIGKDAFIGSNTALVAPVEIGEGAMIGAGSTITKNVEAGSLSVARGDQKTIQGWATKFKEKMKLKKAEKKAS